MTDSIPSSAATTGTGPTGSTHDRFTLSGRSAVLDRRVNAVRGDIADLALAGTLFAPHYARPMPRICTAPHQMLRAAPSATTAGISQILRGEGFAVVDISGGWAWGYSLHDHYVGYLPATALGEEAAPTHVVDQRAALIFTTADPRSPVLGVLPMGARFPAESEGAFLKMPDGYVHHRHATAIGSITADPATLAERLVGMPYLWGGRGGDGIDCSGLAQVTFGLAGTALPRDSDQQFVAAGTDIASDKPLQRGDLIFLPDHVAMMIDAENVIHANGHAMAVAIEPLADMLARYAQNGDAVLARRRIP